MAFTPISSQGGFPLTGRIEASISPSGFVPLDPIAASRVKPVRSLEALIAEKSAGEFPQRSQLLAAFARGALESALAGTTEAAGSLAGANPQFDPNAPQLTDPNAFAIGEVVGSAIPLGRLKKAGTGLWRAVKEGIRLGGVYGGGQGVSEAVRDQTQSTSTETSGVGAALSSIAPAVEQGLKRGALGSALGGVIPLSVGSTLKLIPTKQNILDDLSKISTADEGKLQRSVSGGYVQAAEKVTPYLKKGDGVPAFIEATEKALEKEANVFKPIIQKANPSYLNPDALYGEVDLELSKLIPNPETRKDLLLNSGDFLSDLTQITPDNFLQYASKANREVGRIYKNPSTPITQEALAAKEAVRDVYGNTIRRILEDSGQDPSVYSGYGAIREMGSQIGKNYLRESYKLSVQKGRTIPQNVMSGLEKGGGGLNVGRAIQESLAPITEGEKGRLNRQISGLVDGFLGYGREKTDAAKAEKLDLALKILNTINKNNAEPLTTADFISKKVSGQKSSRK